MDEPVQDGPITANNNESPSVSRVAETRGCVRDKVRSLGVVDEGAYAGL
jgi:hypothetical protein